MRRRVDRQTLEATVGLPFVFFIKKASQLEEQVYSIPIGWCTCSCPLGMWWFWLWIHQGFHWCQLSTRKLGSKFLSCQVCWQVNSSFFVVGRSEKFNTMRWYDTQYIVLLLPLMGNMVFLWSVESCAPHQQEHTTTPSIQKGSALNQQGMSKAECLEFLGIWKLVISWAVVEWDHVLKYPVFLMAVTRKLGSTQALVASWAWWALSWRLRFVQKAIALALTRDGSSGGMVRTLVITKDKADCDQNHHGDANKKVWALFFLL